jgi:hypothetical protein
MIRILSKFWFKVVFLFILIFISSSAVTQVNVGEPQYISICNTPFVLTKYSVIPPPGYVTTWILDRQLNILGSINSNTISIQWENPGSYTIVVQYSNGDCFAQNELNVVVEGCPDMTLYIPNTFTPDGDNSNDKFGAYGIGITKFNMRIWNRWGEMIFEANSLEDRWNGIYRGEICQDDIYVYQIKYEGVNYKSGYIYGRVLLIK